MTKTVRQYWQPFRGRRRLNFNWDAIEHDSVVLISASEFRPEREPSDDPRFVGGAVIGVENVSPHGPPYDPNHGVTFEVNVEWNEPLRVVTDITILDAPPIEIHLNHAQLDFIMEHQQQTNWCWAATSTSVALYYNAASGWTQCSVANTELTRTDCCSTGASGPCNVSNVLNHPLSVVGHLDRMIPASTSFVDVQATIDVGRPLALRVAWTGGGAHFLVIDGYDAHGGQWVSVDDPIYGPADVLYTTMLSGYQGAGTWTTSYLTRP